MGDWDDGKKMGLWGEDGIPYSSGTAMDDPNDPITNRYKRLDEELVANNIEGTVYWWSTYDYNDEIFNENNSNNILLQNQSELLDTIVENIISIKARLDELEDRIDQIL